MTPILEAIIKRNFMFISSDNCKSQKSQFYGYAISENKIYIRSNPTEQLFDKLTAGVFINIVCKENEIIIQQDYFCGFGIYIFRNNSYWAISNSLYYLIKILACRFNLDINEEYIALYLSSSLVPPTVNETVINDISELAQGKYLIIKNGELYEENYSYDIKKMNILSYEAIDLINRWKIKWQSLIGYLNAAGKCVSADLSGGFDTRAVLCIIKDIVKNEADFEIISADDNLHCHSDDYRIASQIANIYGFKLNQTNKKHATGHLLSTLDCIEILQYSNFFSSAEFHYCYSLYQEPVYLVSGNGGAIWRWYDFNAKNIEEYLIEKKLFPVFGNLNLYDKIENIINRQMDFINLNYSEDVNAMHKLYYYGHLKHADMRHIAMNSLFNRIILAPLLDPELQLLNLTRSELDDPLTFYALLYSLYLPEIKNIGIEGGRFIQQKTRDLADAFINSIPIAVSSEIQEWELISTDYNFPSMPYSPAKAEPNLYMINLYKSDSVKRFISYRYSNALYKWGLDWQSRHKFYSERRINQLLSIYILYNILHPGGLLPDMSGYKPTNAMQNFMTILNTARIDIKNDGDSANNIEIINNNDDLLKMEYPRWFSDNYGAGVVLESSSGSLWVDFMCKGKSNLMIRFMAKDWRDNKNQRISCKIDYDKINITIAGKEIFNAAELLSVSHDQPYKVFHHVNNNDIISLSVSWKPYDYSANELSSMFNVILDRYGPSIIE